MPKRAPSPEDFDVTEFLRPSDADMRSALGSLLGNVDQQQTSRGTVVDAKGQAQIPDTLREDNLPPGGYKPPVPGLPPGVNLHPDTHLARVSNLPPGGQNSVTNNLPNVRGEESVVSDTSPRRNTPREGKLPPGGHNNNKANGPRGHRCIRAQDGHTTAEEVLYQALWREAKPETRESRVITIGYRGMSSLTRLDPKTVKYICQHLITKLAIEQIGCESTFQSIGRTYRIHSYRAIMDRRKLAGLEWIVRQRGGGVVFISPPGGSLPTEGALPTGPIGNLPTAPGRNLPPGGEGGPGGHLPPPKDNVVQRQQQQTSVREIAAIARALQRHVPITDDDVAVDLVNSCLAVVPDATTEEIIHFIDIKADLMARMITIRNPVGFLRHAVPKCFEGPAFQQYRQLESQRREALAHDESFNGPRVTPAPTSKDGILPDQDVLAELVNRGIAPKQAENLLRQLPPNQNVFDQLDYGDYLIRQRPDTFRNPPGFYISLIKDNIVPPATFETRQRRQQREQREQSLHTARVKEQQLRDTYEQLYRDGEIDMHIKNKMSEVEYNQRLVDYKQKYQRDWPRLSDDTITQIAHGAIRGDVAATLPLFPFDAWKEKYLKGQAHGTGELVE